MTTLAPAQADARLFGDVLSCELRLPVRMHASLQPLARSHSLAAEGLLRAVALVENTHAEDAGDDHGAQELALQRIEAKLDLLLGLVGRLQAVEPEAVDEKSVRWSHLGVCVVLPGAWSEGDVALVCLPVASWLPQRLELPVRVLATESVGNEENRLWLAVEPLTETLAEALKRHLFRLHRRAVAEGRRTS